eukprot:COSAG05_NODE_6823_length_896_cov_7.531995_1_plen_89_part_10
MAAWQLSCASRMVAAGLACWYPRWCDDMAAGSASRLGAAAAVNSMAVVAICWSRWSVLAPRTKAEDVAARGRSFVGKSMRSFMGKSMSH